MRQAPAVIGTRVLSAPHGTLSVQPNGQTTFRLTAWTTLSSRTLDTTTVAVNLPTDPTTGRTTVHVTANNQQAMLMQALGTPGAVVSRTT
jgi:VCBS repeat-containing protein